MYNKIISLAPNYKKSPLFQDKGLAPYSNKLVERYHQFIDTKKKLIATNKSLIDFANGHQYYGLHKTDSGWTFREWAPNAKKIYLVGEFNYWKQYETFRLTRLGTNGDWEIVLPNNALKHGQQYKLKMYWGDEVADRLPSYAKRVIQEKKSHIFNAEIWQPPKPYQWKIEKFKRDTSVAPLFYEAHIGMAQEHTNIGSFKQFQKNILPIISAAGYNVIQLMATLEHPYYASFGYHVSNFFSISSRFGTPDELKELIDEAHAKGIAIIIDLVHSHSVRNELEGLSKFDGTSNQYFCEGERGYHQQWDSMCFDYGKDKVLHFLLSNDKFLMEEFNLDGFRFDGITSMLYEDHGINRAFTGYPDYFGSNTNNQAITYLTLANKLIHEINPHAITVAEDVSGMPGLASPIAEGGMGFDMRMAMGVTDQWYKNFDIPDKNWNMEKLWDELTSGRKEEKLVSYSECHDQAMVGSKTISQVLAGNRIYDSMDKKNKDPQIERMMALHKMIRLITLSTSRSGYLNFMGNEFGHPEWIDFPREGNKESYDHAKRNWSLSFNPSLKFQYLAAFDKTMLNLEHQYRFISKNNPALWHIHEEHKIIAFNRDPLFFIFNFHPSKSFTDYQVSVPQPGKYRLILDSDHADFGGHNRIKDAQEYFSQPSNNNNSQHLQTYLPNRSALALKYIDGNQ